MGESRVPVKIAATILCNRCWNPLESPHIPEGLCSTCRKQIGDYARTIDHIKPEYSYICKADTLHTYGYFGSTERYCLDCNKTVGKSHVAHYMNRPSSYLAVKDNVDKEGFIAEYKLRLVENGFIFPTVMLQDSSLEYIPDMRLTANKITAAKFESDKIITAAKDLITGSYELAKDHKALLKAQASYNMVKTEENKTRWAYKYKQRINNLLDNVRYESIMWNTTCPYCGWVTTLDENGKEKCQNTECIETRRPRLRESIPEPKRWKAIVGYISLAICIIGIFIGSYGITTLGNSSKTFRQIETQQEATQVSAADKLAEANQINYVAMMSDVGQPVAQYAIRGKILQLPNGYSFAILTNGQRIEWSRGARLVFSDKPLTNVTTASTVAP